MAMIIGTIKVIIARQRVGQRHYRHEFQRDTKRRNGLSIPCRRKQPQGRHQYSYDEYFVAKPLLEHIGNFEEYS